MSSVRAIPRSSRRNRGSSGSLLEYALGIALVALSALLATQMVGCRVNHAFAKVTEGMSKAF